MTSKSLVALAVAAQLASTGCGSSSPAPVNNNVVVTTGQNVQPIVVNPGPANDYANGVFTSVTICVPGSNTNCQTISGILVDTGSTGLRILSSALTLSLPQQNAGGNPVVECFPFEDGFTWGPVQTADVAMASERAASVPIQIVGASAFPTIPNSCTSMGGPPENTIDTLDANGVLGIGLFRQDCGPACAVSGASNPGLYYSCAGANCQIIPESLTQQLQNPVWMFSTDNNGVIVELPAIASTGASVVSGSLVFGIGTQPDNALGSASIYTVDGEGTFSTTFQGKSYGGAFIDTGSNGLFFLDAATTGLTLCADSDSFYCPPTSQAFTATTRGANGTSGNVTFSVGNADQQLNNLMLSAFPMLAGPNPGTFDWGLPFFFGRNVFTAIESQTTPAGFGPYWAF